MMRPSILLLSALALVTASPVSPRQACSTIYPSSLGSIVNSQPDTFFPGPAPPLPFGGGETFFLPEGLITTLNSHHLIAQSQPGTGISPQVSLQVVDFFIPANVNTCQMFINDTTSQLVFEKDGITTAPAPAMNVMSLVLNADMGPSTYNSIFNASPSVIDSFHWNPATIAKGGYRLIGGFPCSPNNNKQQTNATFLIEIAPDQIGPGSSDWILPQTLESDEGFLARSGVYVTYCLNWN